jgi:hypothetical protein
MNYHCEEHWENCDKWDCNDMDCLNHPCRKPDPSDEDTNPPIVEWDEPPVMICVGLPYIPLFFHEQTPLNYY